MSSSLISIELVAVHTIKYDALSVYLHDTVHHFETAEAYRLLYDLGYLTLFILES